MYDEKEAQQVNISFHVNWIVEYRIESEPLKLEVKN